MRTILSLKCIVMFVCLLCPSEADAAERFIRPRRVNRAVPKVIAPFTTDGITPPDSALWPVKNPAPPASRENGDGTPETYQADGANPPAFSPFLPDGGDEAMRNIMERASAEIDEQPAIVRKTPESKPGAAKIPEAPEPASSPPASGDHYQGMNQRRQDFNAPMRKEEEREEEGTEETAEAEKAREEPEAGPALTKRSVEQPEPPASMPDYDRIINSAPPLLYAGADGEPCPASGPEEPTPAEVESYRRRLELRLLERYNNLPDHAGQVAKVSVVLSRPLQPSLDGTRLRAEFDQLVYDPWGKRIPALEKEYYVVTFGSGGVRQVRSDPSIRVGLNIERKHSLPGPGSDIGAKMKSLPPDHAFRAAPAADATTVKMPDWWRPEFADDGY